MTPVGRLILAAALAGAALAGCRPKVTSTQCDELVDRYARLVVTERFPDAGAERIRAEQERERVEARGDDSFKNCVSEVSRAELACAMSATTTAAIEKCLE